MKWKAFVRHKPFVLTVDCLLLFSGVIGLYHVAQKAGIPVEFEDWSEGVRCVKVRDAGYEQYIQPGDVVRSVGHVPIQRVEDIEFLLDARSIGEVVPFEIESLAGSLSITIPLTSYYDTFYDVIASIVGGLFYLIGVFVYYQKPRDKAAILFHWGMMCAAIMMLVTWGRYTFPSAEIGVGLRGVFFLAHGLLPVFFFHFTLVFPREKWPTLRQSVVALYGLGGVLAIWAGINFFEAASQTSVEVFGKSLRAFFVSRWFLVGLGVFSLLSLVHSYRTAVEESERRKLRWVLWGLLIGFPPYIVLWVVPQMIIMQGLIPEAIVLLFSSLIPITFGISIVRHRLMNIDLILNRSVVYGVVMTFVFSIFAAIVGISAVLVTSYTAQVSFIVSGFAAIVVALLFEPIRGRVQQFVDKRFFRIHYDFREAQRILIEEIKHSLDINQLAELVVRRTDELLSLERIGFFRVRESSQRLQLLAHRNFDILEKHGVRFETQKLKTSLHLPVALDDNVEPGARVESADVHVFRRWGMALVCTMLSESGEILGFLVMGEKKSGARFTVEDVDLLTIISARAGLAIEHITLQQKLLLERAEAQRLEELSRLKSYFVSSVSHDLKTPLTSIKAFAELLRAGKKISQKKEQEYLEIIEGESDRLTRLINNVLDFARVERGVMEYQFGDVRLNDLVQNVLRSMKYQFRMEQCSVRARFSKKDQCIRADADALTEGLINILSNAVKYSLRKKQVAVSTFHRNGFAAVRVEDKGVGIARRDLNRIFEPFFRARSETTMQVGGVGLGLSLVKHMIEAHGGRIEVRSTPGKGSSFTLLFPMQGAR